MPAFKHPCPHCGKYIQRDVAACPYCARSDPFAPARCPSCRTVLEDPAWAVCPRCGTQLRAVAPGAAAGPYQPPLASGPAHPTPPVAGYGGDPVGPVGSVSATNPVGPATPASPGGQPAAGRCSACGEPLAAGARFCATCGTLTG